MLRVIFDRSAFHGERFSLLSTSQLQTCCRKRKLSVAHTPIFLEETLRMYGKKREQLRQQMPFILDICNGGIYHHTETIWERELVFNHGPSTNIFRFKREQETLEQNIQKGILKENWSDWKFSLWNDMETNKEAQYAFYREFRSESSLRKRSFNDYLEPYLDDTGRCIIQYHIEAKNNEYLQDKWSNNKEYYPFITAFVKGAVFSEYYAAIEKNKRLDKNAQTDWQLMTYLNRADILVSADMKFQRSAFVALWEPHGKKFMTPGEFVNFIKTL